VAEVASKRVPALVAAVIVAAAMAWFAIARGPARIGEAVGSWMPHVPFLSAPVAASSGPATVAELEQHLQRHPGDARALVLKARLDMQAQRFEPAAQGYRKALEISTKVARDAAVWVEYAEARGMLQQGRLDGEPRQLVDKALALDATNPQALDLAGSAAWERRDFAAAALHWRHLLEQLAPGSARHAELSAAIEAADRRARLSLPPAR
jgi:cytochrome c-type biogenesis protein CcmH